MIGATRRYFEAGHWPKFLVVVDETPECGKAIRFGARRCTRTGAKLLMLGIVPEPENFEFLGVGDALREEAREAAEALLETAVADAKAAAPGLEPECVVRVGDKAEAILTLIREDEDISFLVLAAGTTSSGPGPLVAGLAGAMAGAFPVPVVVVPGGLADEAIDALAG